MVLILPDPADLLYTIMSIYEPIFFFLDERVNILFIKLHHIKQLIISPALSVLKKTK